MKLQVKSVVNLRHVLTLPTLTLFALPTTVQMERLGLVFQTEQLELGMTVQEPEEPVMNREAIQTQRQR